MESAAAFACLRRAARHVCRGWNVASVTAQPISTLLVANRGEIALRVFASARSMGIRCIAVFVDDDENAPFVNEADEAIRLPTGYLDGEAIIGAALQTGADAVHPGYGFLSENSAFAEAVLTAGLTWVGPSPHVIEVMGDKIAAKRSAIAAEVPTLPSTENVEDADTIGYPILVKAAGGGGGKGMRIVQQPADLAEAVASAQREASGAFGDDRVFLERYIVSARHIEIQILGDQHGALVHLGERECSIQRRHQKIIEESPSPMVDDAMRDAMGESALKLARSIGYQSAGTVEFVVDDATREYFFLEVNTRLQVEHPVTEAVTGIDLVREQIRVAGGEALGYEQRAITWTGHAIEARLYAEDAARGFLPATGTLEVFEPAAQPAVRWDSGVTSGSVVSVSFDPMLAKVIAHATTRTEAAQKLARSLELLHVAGVTTNRDFLVSSLRHPAFLEGRLTTDFIDRETPAAELYVDDAELYRAAVATSLWIQARNRTTAAVLDQLPSGWRNSRLPPQHVAFTAGDRAVEVNYRQLRDGSFRLEGDGLARIHGWTSSEIDVEIDNRRSVRRISRVADSVHVQVGAGWVDLSVLPRFALPITVEAAGSLNAPMPGIVSDVRVAVGDAVSGGQVLVVLEAMKMEHHIVALADGVVTEVYVRTGGQVQTSDLLLVVESAESDPIPDQTESNGS